MMYNIYSELRMEPINNQKITEEQGGYNQPIHEIQGKKMTITKNV